VRVLPRSCAGPVMDRPCCCAPHTPSATVAATAAATVASKLSLSNRAGARLLGLTCSGFCCCSCRSAMYWHTAGAEAGGWAVDRHVSSHAGGWWVARQGGERQTLHGMAWHGMAWKADYAASSLRQAGNSQVLCESEHRQEPHGADVHWRHGSRWQQM
jgi:hypothetical protein